MLAQVASVFVDVVAPVFAIVGLGSLLGPRLALEARTLARVAYHVFIPAFTFHVVSSAHISLARAGRMALYVLASHAVFAGLAWASSCRSRCASAWPPASAAAA